MIDQSKLHEKIVSNAGSERISASYLLMYHFNDLPNKEQAWNDIFRIADSDRSLKTIAINYLGRLFEYSPDKNKSWGDLVELAQKGYGDEKKLAISLLGLAFEFVPDKDSAWSRLIALLKVNDSESQNLIACILETSFELLPDKDRAWDDLIQLVGNGYGDYQKTIADFLGRIFESTPNKDKAWKDLIRLSETGYSDIQKILINSIMMASEHNQDKAQVWRDFIMLSGKRSMDIKEVAVTLKILFKQVPDRTNAWNDLLALLPKFYGDDQKAIINLLGNVSNYATDRQKVIDDLIKLSQEGPYDIKPLAACALKKAYDLGQFESVDISTRIKDIIRIAVAQLGFELTNSFPPRLVDRESTKKKVFSALKTAKQHNANIVCLPELCMSEEWLKEIENAYPDVIVIAGSYYNKSNQNISEILVDSHNDIPPQIKVNPSVPENSNFLETRMNSGDRINVYKTKYGIFSVLICRDFGKFASLLRGKVDMILVPSYNRANDRFHKEADNHVTNSPSYVIISNTAIFGGTSIFGQLNNTYLKELEKKGYKKEGDNSYKLCEIEECEEGLIIADFNLVHKSPPLQAPIDAAEELKLLSVTNINKVDLFK